MLLLQADVNTGTGIVARTCVEGGVSDLVENRRLDPRAEQFRSASRLLAVPSPVANSWLTYSN